MLELLLPLDRSDTLKAADLIFADSVALGIIQHLKAIHYSLISHDSLEYLATMILSFDWSDATSFRGVTKRETRRDRRSSIRLLKPTWEYSQAVECCHFLRDTPERDRLTTI